MHALQQTVRYSLKQSQIENFNLQDLNKTKFCIPRYTSEKSLRAHIMFHHNEDGEAKGVICEFCGRQFISRASVISHVHTVHRTESDPNNQKVWHHRRKSK